MLTIEEFEQKSFDEQRSLLFKVLKPNVEKAPVYAKLYARVELAENRDSLVKVMAILIEALNSLTAQQKIQAASQLEHYQSVLEQIHKREIEDSKEEDPEEMLNSIE